MTYLIVVIFLMSSALLLLALCRTAKAFGEFEPELVPSQETSTHRPSDYDVGNQEEAA